MGAIRNNKPKETRLREIIETAMELFLKNGFEGTTMQSIADKSGLSKGGLYHHFISKDEVLLAANRVYFSPVIEMMDKAQENPSPKEGLKTFISEYIKYWSMHQRELIFSNLSRSKIIANIQLWKYITEFSEMMLNFYETLLKNGTALGELREHDTKGRAVTLFAALDGITPYLVMSKGITPNQTIRGIENTCLEGLEIITP